MKEESPKVQNLSWSVVCGMMAVEAVAMIVLVSGAGLVWGLTQNPARDNSAGQTKAIAEIRTEIAKQMDAWNNGDLEGYMAGYWKDDKMSFFSGDNVTTGWQPTMDRYAKRYKGEGKAMGQLTFSDIDITMLANDAAFVRGRWKLDRPDKTAPAGLFTLIVRRIGNDWRIIHDHTSVKSP